nr:beta-L-arabinofuranosidase domain-containing protein [Candidatus Prometheoarchaeum syntrophicum]QEE15983.1 hypothetical protein DSAG12_01811 [Candidatus Prometheoarchaeum syntrophicum]
MRSLNKNLQILKEFPISSIQIQDKFWTPRLQRNQEDLLIYQFNQLERTGCIDNFRILAGKKDGIRKGFFFSDSDAYKWAEAAAISLNMTKNQDLLDKLDEFIEIIEKAQHNDGYLYTYNQINFKNRRWSNLPMEHELYCMGHLIEAGIAHFIATNSKKFLNIAIKSADLIVREFLNKSPEKTSGHEEIELALLRLYKITKNLNYLNLSQQFLEQRGKIEHFIPILIRSVLNQRKAEKDIKKGLKKEPKNKKKVRSHDLSENINKRENFLFLIRMLRSALSGRYFQQDIPFNKMHKADGHSVRWGYYMIGHTLLSQETKDYSKIIQLNNIWENTITKRMYLTGGLGSIPIIEGFGRDYELSNKHAYCETCAAISGIFWNWEMLKCTGEAKFADLLEWQLYNASLVGISSMDNLYFYRNVLESDGNFYRSPWFDTACCPSNLSRLWGMVGKYIYTVSSEILWIHQYIGNKSNLSVPLRKKGEAISLSVQLNSSFPWEGECEVTINLDKPTFFSLNLRIPSWVEEYSIFINDQPFSSSEIDKIPENISTASGYSPYRSKYITIKREWNLNDKIRINFPMIIKIHRSHPKVRTNRNKIALSRGPIVYCLEDLDNPKAKIPKACINLNEPLKASFLNNLLNGVHILEGKDCYDNSLVFIPYFLWANREISKMQVYVSEK